MQTILMKPASGLCNMQCGYCFYCDEADKRKTQCYGMMSEETLKNIVRKVLLGAKSDVCFAFQGGEPTLRGLGFFETLMEFERKFNKNKVGIENAIQTNGLELTSQWCGFLKKNQFLVGLSVDGIKECHDLYRRSKSGRGTYDRVKRSAELLQEYEIDFNILTVVNRAVAMNIGEIYKNFKQSGWMFQQYIACLEPYTEEAFNQASDHRPWSLTARDYGQFLINLFDLWHKDWKRGKAPYIRQFENYIGILMGRPPESCEQMGVCSVQCVVEADGSVFPCDFYAMDEYRLGNFNEQKMKDFFQCSVARNFVAKSREVHPDCRECRYYHICRGGCRRNRVLDPVSGLYKNRFCESSRMFFDRAYKRMEEAAQFLSGHKISNKSSHN